MKKSFPIILIAMLVILMVSLTGCNLITGFLNDVADSIPDKEDTSGTGDKGDKKDYYNSGEFEEDGVKVLYYFYLSVPEINIVESFTSEVEYTKSKEAGLTHCPADPDEHSIPQGWKIEDETIATFEIVDKYRCVITGLKEGVTYIHARLDSKDKIRTDDYKITVSKKVPTKLEISKNKTIYMEGDSFNSNFTLTATFNNNNELKHAVEPTNIDTSAVDLNTKGTYPVKVTYTFNDTTLEKTYNVQVVDASSAVYTADYLDYTYEDYYDHYWADNLKTAFMPTSGTVKYLVIPVWFNDSGKFFGENAADKTNTRNKLYTAFFGSKNTTNGKNSVKSYYEELSKETLTIEGKVASAFYEPDKLSTYYGLPDCEGNTRELCGEAVDWYFTTYTSEDKASYDSDNNGTLDAIAVVYCAPDKQQILTWLDSHSSDPLKNDYSQSTLWSMVMRGGMDSSAANPADPNLQVCMWATAYDVLQKYNGEDIESKTYLHETGHMFGLEDYYDTHGAYSPAGSRIMMDSNRGSQDPYSALALGWGKAIIPQTSATVELKDFQSSREMLILHPEAEQCNSPFDEYIIVELYTPTGLNQFDAQASPAYEPDNVGIRIWHIDARLIKQLARDEYDFSALYTEPIGTDNYAHRFDNTRGDTTNPLAAELDDYYLIYYVRNMDTGATGYSMTSTQADYLINNETMFYAGDSFTIEDYASQFANGAQGKLNSGVALGWSIYIEGIEETSTGVWTATIQVIKA